MEVHVPGAVVIICQDLYHRLLAPVKLGSYAPTSAMELLAVVFTALSVLGATRLKIAQYPVGILATILYSLVFVDAKLYSSLALNVYFTIIQLYGLYYWMFGGKSRTAAIGWLKLREPLIGDWPWRVVALWGSLAAATSVLVGFVVSKYLHGSSAFMDAAILALSVLAQFLLDRKQLKSWIFWGVVNVLAVVVYGFQQRLLVSGILYTGLFINAFVGYFHWRKVMARQQMVTT